MDSSAWMRGGKHAQVASCVAAAVLKEEILFQSLMNATTHWMDVLHFLSLHWHACVLIAGTLVPLQMRLRGC